MVELMGALAPDPDEVELDRVAAEKKQQERLKQATQQFGDLLGTAWFNYITSQREGRPEQQKNARDNFARALVNQEEAILNYHLPPLHYVQMVKVKEAELLAFEAILDPLREELQWLRSTSSPLGLDGWSRAT